MWADPLLDAYLNGLMQKVLAVAHPRPFQYRIRVVSDGSINAFTFGGGALYIHAGLLARMNNEAQFMMVLAHEVAHVTQRHIPRGIEGSYGIQLLGQIAASAASASGRTAAIPPELLQKTYEYSMNAAVSGHGRSHETEADVVGLEYLVKAGYDPREAPKTFQVLLEEYGDKGAVENFFYGSHPTNQARIAHLSQLIQSKYADAGAGLIVNSAEYKERTRPLVVLAAQHNYRAKRFKTAEALFQRALQSKSDDPTTHYFLGKIAMDTSGAAGADKAIGHFNAALKVNNNFVEPYRELGLAYYLKKDSANALRAFERYLALNPRAADAGPIRGYIDELKSR
jgi:predicted Zn-dependent protease